MFRFLVRRILLLIPVLLGLLILTFVLIRILPSDPAAAIAGQNTTPEQIEAIKQQYGFDKPIITQFGIYLNQVAHGSLGTSVYSGLPVASEIKDRLGATLELTFCALLIGIGFGVPLGVIAAVYHNRVPDFLLRSVSIAGVAVASFWLAIMLQLLFSMKLDWLPLGGRLDAAMDTPSTITGFYLIDSLIAMRFDIFVDAVKHLILPAFALSLGSIATLMRFARAGMLETLQKDYITYETAAGYPRARIIGVYALRNSLAGVITQLGLLFGALVGNAVVVESIFSWPGLGSYSVSAILNSDYNAILAVSLVIGVVYALMNIAVDLLHALIDPQVAERL
jgi:peptide/nickel transport system permease protein